MIAYVKYDSRLKRLCAIKKRLRGNGETISGADADSFLGGSAPPHLRSLQLERIPFPILVLFSGFRNGPASFSFRIAQPP